MYKPIHVLIFLLMTYAGGVALGGEVTVKVAIEDALPEAKVLGVETYYGLIIAAQKIENLEKPKNVKVEEITSSEVLVLKNGRYIEVRDVEFLYVRQKTSMTALRNDQGKHPNTDEGASGTH